MIELGLLSRDHTFMTATKNDQFCDASPPPFAKMNADLLFKNKIICCLRGTNFKTPPSNMKKASLVRGVQIF